MEDTKFTLNLRTGLGVSLRPTVEDAIRIAKTLNVSVKFDWWDEKLVVYPDTDIEVWFERHKELLGL